MGICQREEREAGRSYPRTCPTCKLGPCQRSAAKPQPSHDPSDAIRALTPPADLAAKIGGAA